MFATILIAGNLEAQEEMDTLELEPFMIIGSRLLVTEMAEESHITPVEIMDSLDFERLGYSTVTEALQSLTINNGGSIPISNNAGDSTQSASSVSLRGLGPEATLVLINGRRVAPFPLGDAGTTAFVDLNSFPLASIDRIEVLKEGASALYGADAVAGVVNIVTRRDFDGSELTVRYGNTTNHDSSEFTVNLLTGIVGEDSNITVGFNYSKRNPIFRADREYSATPPFLSSFSSPLNVELSREAAEQALGLQPGSPIPGIDDGVDPGARRASFFASTFANREQNQGGLPAEDYAYSRGPSSSYNFNESAGSYPYSERKGGFMSVAKYLNDSDSTYIYGDLFFQQTYTVNEQAPAATGPFRRPGVTTLVVPAQTATPILTAFEMNANTRTAVEGAYNPFNPFNQDLSGNTRARLAEFGNRIFRDSNDALNGVLGIHTDNLFGDWSLDASMNYSSLENKTRNSLVAASLFNRLMNADDPFFDPDSSDFAGTSTPWNPFGYYRNPIENNVLLAPLATVEMKSISKSELYGGQAILSHYDLFQVNENPVGFVAGIEYRWERVDQDPDPLSAGGDIVGLTTDNSTSADREIGALFTELQLPFVTPGNSANWAHSLTLNLSGRYENFLTQHDSVFVPKVSLRYLPFDETFAIRSTWGEGYRQPSLYELYAEGLTFGLSPIVNPVTNDSDPETSVSVASNRNLAAEESENFSYGFIWTPTFLQTESRGTTLSVDLWNIERKGNVSVDYQDVVDRFFANDFLIPGEFVELDGNGQITFIGGVFRNVGNEDAKGIDIGLSQFFETGAGRFDLAVNASYLDSYKIQQFPGAPAFEYVDWQTGVLFNNETGNPRPGIGNDAYLKWKAEVLTSWSMENLTISVIGHYTDGYRDFVFDWDPGNPLDPAGFRRVSAWWYFDFSASYTCWKDSASLLGDTRFTLGARNILDTDPPFVSSWGNNETGYASFLHSAEGRFIFLSVNKRL